MRRDMKAAEALLPELARDAVIVELQKIGFSRDSVLNSIKSGYNLREQLATILSGFNGSTRSDSYRVMVGTAVTVEALDPQGHFLGGFILPGHGIMLRAFGWREK